MIEMLRRFWYGLAARQTVRKTRKRQPDSSAVKDMRRVTGVVEAVRELSFLTMRGFGRTHPVRVTVRYRVDGVDYWKKETILTEERCPKEQEHVAVLFPKHNPHKATCVFWQRELP